MSRYSMNLVLEDVFGRGVGTSVKVSLDQRAEHRSLERQVNVERIVALDNVVPGRYRMRLEPRGYIPIETEIEVTGSNLESRHQFTMPTEEVAGIDAPDYDDLDPVLRGVIEASKVEVGGVTLSGRALWSRLNDPLRASLLNVYTKASHTPLGEASADVFSTFGSIRALTLDKVRFATRPSPAFKGWHPLIERLSLPAADLNLGLARVPRTRGIVLDARVCSPEESTALHPYEIGQQLARNHMAPSYTIRPKRAFSVSGAIPIINLSDLAETTEPRPAIASVRREASPERTVMPAEHQVPLKVHHWIDGDDVSPVAPSDASLVAGRDYWYWFSVEPSDREGAESELFTKAALLDESAESVLTLEVRSTLLAHLVERRKVTYRRRVGIGAQSFQLEAKPGSHSIVSQLVWRNQTLHSKSWTLVVEDPSTGTGAGSAESAPGTAATGGGQEPLADSTGEPPQQLRLVVDHDVHRLLFEIPGSAGIRQLLRTDRQAMNVLAAEARATLNRFAQTDLDEAGAPGAAQARALLVEMARWGRKAFETIFADETGAVSRIVRRFSGGVLEIDGDPTSFPWEWIFVGRDEDIPSAQETSLAFLEGFLGCQLAVSVLHRVDHDALNRSPILKNEPVTRMGASVNATTDKQGGLRSKEYFEKLLLKEGAIRGDMWLGLEQTVSGLCATNKSPGQLLYFYGHHKSGAQLTEYGYTSFGAGTLFLKGRDEEPLTSDHLRYEVKLQPFDEREAPLVFINACVTATGGDYYPSGFIPYFITKLHASGVIGTQAEIPALAAYEFSQDFIRRWLLGAPAAEVLRTMRVEWLERLNPFAMYYTAHGNGQTRLQHRVQ